MHGHAAGATHPLHKCITAPPVWIVPPAQVLAARKALAQAQDELAVVGEELAQARREVSLTKREQARALNGGRLHAGRFDTSTLHYIAQHGRSEHGLFVATLAEAGVSGPLTAVNSAAPHGCVAIRSS
jgi:hypothetical protein